MTTKRAQAGEMLAALNRLSAEVSELSNSFVVEMEQLSSRQTAALVAALEELSRAVEFFQVAGAWAVERVDIAQVGERDGFFGEDSGTAAAAGDGSAGAADGE